MGGVRNDCTIKGKCRIYLKNSVFQTKEKVSKMKILNKKYLIDISRRIKKGTIQGIRFFFIMLILESVIEHFFFWGVSSMPGDEYINWLFIFALVFYLYHYMTTIKWGKTTNSININLRNKKHLYTLQFYLSDIIIPYFLYICTFFISNFITDYPHDLIIFVFLYPFYGLFVWLSMFFCKMALRKHPKIIKVISKAINITIIFIISLMLIWAGICFYDNFA